MVRYRLEIRLGGGEAAQRRARVSAMALEALARDAAWNRPPAAARSEAEFVVVVIPPPVFPAAEVQRHVGTRIAQ